MRNKITGSLHWGLDCGWAQAHARATRARPPLTGLADYTVPEDWHAVGRIYEDRHSLPACLHPGFRRRKRPGVVPVTIPASGGHQSPMHAPPWPKHGYSIAG